MCNICNHPQRTEIDRDLLSWPAVAAVAAHYRLPLEELRRHKACLEARVEHARRQMEQLQLAESLDRLQLLLDKTMQVLTKAEENGDLKMMLQAVREAGRLTNMLHALDLDLDLEAAGLFLAATSKDWEKSASLFPNQPNVRESVRQAIRQSLLMPCAGAHFEGEPLPTPGPVREKSVRPGPVVRAQSPAQTAAIPWSTGSDLEGALALRAAASGGETSRAAP